jgi:hypothetical protein
VDEDNLSDELNLLSKIVQQLKAHDMSVDKKWVKMFPSCDEFKELPKLVAKILSVPISNACVERIFRSLAIPGPTEETASEWNLSNQNCTQNLILI